MKLTDEVIRDKMRFHMERAKKELAKAKPESDPDKTPIAPCVVAIWNNGLEKEYRAGWSNNREKHIWGEAISKACAATHVSVIVGRLITTMVSSVEVSKELGIEPSKINFDEYQKLLFGWVEKTTGGNRFSGLPARFRLDCITICAMGPRFKDSIINQPFEFVNGVWTFPPNPFPTREGQINVIPKWWQ